MSEKKLYIVKNDKGHYWCGYNTWSTELRHSKIYVRYAMAQATVDRFKHKKPLYCRGGTERGA